MNNMEIIIDSNKNNISVVRVAISTFISSINITIDDLMDVKTAVSEAVTNSIEHGYCDSVGKINIICSIEDNNITITVIDYGIGIEDIELATTPTYTSKPELEHAGLGFSIMESFMDTIQIDSSLNNGTKIVMVKKIVKKKSI
ncbi:MAG: anti-sigma F factor [Clostridia bacterium]